MLFLSLQNKRQKSSAYTFAMTSMRLAMTKSLIAFTSSILVDIVDPSWYCSIGAGESYI